MFKSPYAHLLRNNRGFTLLWSAQVISLLGDWFNTITLSTLVVTYTDGSGLAVSAFLMARFLPPLLFGPFAGVLVDRFDRKAILIFSNILRTIVVLMFLFADQPDRLWIIYVLTLVQFTLSALFEPGQSALIPSLIGREQLVIANTLTSITWSVMLALGAIIGGIVGALFGAAVALTIDALTFAVAAAFIWMIDVPENLPTHDTDYPEDNGGFLQGVRYMSANPAIAAVALVKGGGSIGNVDTLMTIYATEIFILGSGGQLSLGIFYSAFGVGAILGPLLLNRINDGTIFRMTQLITIGFVLAFAGWIMFGISDSLWMVAFALVIRAMGGSANWTYSSVILQKSVPDRFLGRVFALDLAAFQLATVGSIVVHGGLIDVVRSNTRSNNPLLDSTHVPILNTLGGLLETVTTNDLQLLTFGTAVVSLLPLILWMSIIPRMRRKHKQQE